LLTSSCGSWTVATASTGCSLHLVQGTSIVGAGSNCWSRRTSLLSGVLLKQMMVITSKSCFNLAHQINGLPPWATPLFIFFIGLLHEHECFELVLDTLFALDQRTWWNFTIWAHFLEGQDELLILPLDTPKSCHSSNCSYLGLKNFNLLLLFHNLRKSPLKQQVHLSGNLCCWFLVKTVTFCLSIVNLIVLRQESIEHF
jgi:hypothetical protein